MKRKNISVITGLMVFCGMLVGWTIKQKYVVQQPCPFDLDLSVGAAFRGPFLHFDTYAVQDKTMNARIAWFQPIEKPNPDAFSDRVAQEPPEEDWDWWTTLYPTILIVRVTDTQKRLGKIEIWNFDTQLLEGILKASPDGSTVNGSLQLSKPASFRTMIIKDRKNQPLAKALLQNPETMLILVEQFANWVPHPPLRGVVVEELERKFHHHTISIKSQGETISTDAPCDIIRWQAKEGCPPCTGFNDQHFAHSLRYDVKVIFGPPPKGCSIQDIRGAESCGTWVEVIPGGQPIPPGVGLCMTKQFVNDSPRPVKITPPQDYTKRHVLKKIKEFPPRDLVAEGSRPILDRLVDLQTEKAEDVISITPSVEVPPYSEGCLHWDINARTDIRALLVAPFRKVEKRPDLFERFILSALRILVAGIMGRAHPKTNALVEALVEAWTEDVSKRREVQEAGFKVGDLKFYGDIWVLYLGLARAELMAPPPPRNILQKIKVQIFVGDTPMYGELSVKRLEATTTPSPPEVPLLEEFSTTIPKDGKDIWLGKGWRWELTAFAIGHKATVKIAVPREPPEVVIRIPVPQLPKPPDE